MMRVDRQDSIKGLHYPRLFSKAQNANSERLTYRCSRARKQASKHSTLTLFFHVEPIVVFGPAELSVRRGL